jgi:hypothetical protein
MESATPGSGTIDRVLDGPRVPEFTDDEPWDYSEVVPRLVVEDGAK